MKQIILYTLTCTLLFSNLFIENDPDVITGKLDNGITYYIKENNQPEDQIELRLVINAGSMLEDEDQLGLAHFLEHMAFNGTELYPKNEIVSYLQSIGMQFGPDLNAYTAFDETVYMLQIPTKNEEFVDKGFEILSQWFTSLSLKDDEIDGERDVIVEEWRLRRGAGSRIQEQHIENLFPNSRYSKRSPIGDIEIIQNFTYDKIKSYYKDWYRTDLCAVIVVGDINPQDALNYIEEYFSDIPVLENPRIRTYDKIQSFEEDRISVVSDPELQYPSISVSYMYDKIENLDDLNNFKTLIIQDIITQMINMRLNELTTNPNSPYLYAYSDFTRIMGRDLFRENRMYSITAYTKEEQILEGFKQTLTEINRIKEFGFIESEYNRVVSQIKNTLETQLNEKDNTDSKYFTNKYINHFLVGIPYLSFENRITIFDKITEEITLEDINNHIELMFIENNTFYTVEYPEKDNIEEITNNDIKEIINTKVDDDIVAYEEEEITNNLFKGTDNSTGYIVSTNNNDQLNTTEITLSNNIKVIYKKTDFKSDQILMTAFRPGGHSNVNDNMFHSSEIAASIINQSGIGDLNQINFEKFLSDKNVIVKPYIDQNFEGLTGESTNKDLELMFQLTNMYFTDYNKDNEAFENYIDQYRNTILNNGNNPQVVFRDSIVANVNDYHYRSLPINLNQINDITLDKVYNFYESRFDNAYGYTFIFIGNIDEEIFINYVSEYIATLPSAYETHQWRDLNMTYPEGITSKEIYKGIEPQSIVFMSFKGDKEWNVQNSYNINSLSSALDILLTEVIREELGGVYFIGTYGDISRIPNDTYSFSIYFGCDPENVENIINTIHEQIDIIKSSGFDVSYLDKVKNSQLNTYEKSINENEFWLNSLTTLYTDNHHGVILPYDIVNSITNFDDLVNSLEIDDLKTFSNQYLKKDNYIQLILYPETKNEEK